jgi:hypothetical protein
VSLRVSVTTLTCTIIDRTPDTCKRESPYFITESVNAVRRPTGRKPHSTAQPDHDGTPTRRRRLRQRQKPQPTAQQDNDGTASSAPSFTNAENRARHSNRPRRHALVGTVLDNAGNRTRHRNPTTTGTPSSPPSRAELPNPVPFAPDRPARQRQRK